MAVKNRLLQPAGGGILDFGKRLAYSEDTEIQVPE